MHSSYIVILSKCNFETYRNNKNVRFEHNFNSISLYFLLYNKLSQNQLLTHLSIVFKIIENVLSVDSSDLNKISR